MFFNIKVFCKTGIGDTSNQMVKHLHVQGVFSSKNQNKQDESLNIEIIVLISLERFCQYLYKNMIHLNSWNILLLVLIKNWLKN